MAQKPLALIDSVAQRAESFFDSGPIRRRARQLLRGMLKHRVARAASAMAFDLFLAAIPMLALAGWIFAALLERSEDALDAVSLLLDLTPNEVNNLVRVNLRRFSAGAVAPIAILGALWLASSAFHTLMSVFELAVHAVRRSWWNKRMIAIGCVLVGIGGLALSGYFAVLIAGGPIALLESFAPTYSGTGAKLARWIAPLVAWAGATALLAGFFRIAVRRPHVKRRVWPGAFLTMAIGGASSALFGYYAGHLARFSLFYGSLAAVAVTMAWLWIICAALLVGAELNAQLEGEEPDRKAQ
jgi:membrane protein